MNVPEEHYRQLYKLFASIKDVEESEQFLIDMLTPQELDSLAERWQLIQELHKGTPQREISEKLGLSISKITRGSRVLQYGTGGFAKLLKRLQ